MSKVITFSLYFPGYHPRKGEPTYFVEKIHHNIWHSIPDDWMDAQSMIWDLNKHLPRKIVHDFIESLDMEANFADISKGHTIRYGNNFKVGDLFSPRVWSGKPYGSKQIIIAPDIQVKKSWDFESTHDEIYLNGITILGSKTVDHIAKNDGLTIEDFFRWFNKPFEGQIICWNENINY